MKKVSFMLTAALCMAASCTREAPRTVYLQDYLTPEMLETDAEPAIRLALEECSKSSNSTLVLPGDTLRIRPDFCFGKYQIISNNDPSDKRIAFEIDGVDGLTIEGNNTLLLFSGFVSPFNIENSKNITIRNLSMDYTRTHHSEGTVTGTGKGWVTLRFPEDYIIRIQNGILAFRDQDKVEYPYCNLLEFDSEKREVAHYVHDHWIWGAGLQAEQLPDGQVRVYKDDIEATVGNILVFGAKARLCPGFTLDGVDGFLMENVNIWHCGGMGVIAQRSSDLELNRVNVVPSPGKDRMISITADATHFINCKGYIRMIGCDFRNQKDDATNIHGWYASAKKKTADDQLLCWFNYGFDFIRPGMELEIVNHRTMMTYDTLKVKEVTRYNDDYSLVTFTGPVPECFEINDALADSQANTAEVLIKDCYIGNNRARGILIGSKGKVVIEDNTFHAPGTAILFEGDGNYWFEQSGVKDVIIRNNLFDNCLYGSSTWGNANICVGSGIPEHEGSRYHSNILIEGNTFRTFDPRILNFYCVDGVTYRGNKVEMSSDYVYGRSGEAFTMNECDNVNIEE